MSIEKKSNECEGTYKGRRMQRDVEAAKKRKRKCSRTEQKR